MQQQPGWKSQDQGWICFYTCAWIVNILKKKKNAKKTQILAAQTDGSSLEGSSPADKGKFKDSEKSRIFSFNFSYLMRLIAMWPGTDWCGIVMQSNFPIIFEILCVQRNPSLCNPVEKNLLSVEVPLNPDVGCQGSNLKKKFFLLEEIGKGFCRWEAALAATQTNTGLCLCPMYRI